MTTPSSCSEFDADAELLRLRQDAQALEPPTFRRGGRLYKGRVLSFAQWQRFEDRLVAWGRGELSPTQLQALFYGYVSAVFPHPWWKVWERSVAWKVLMLPPAVQREAVLRFLEFQRPAVERWLGTLTDGSSLPPAADAPPAE